MQLTEEQKKDVMVVMRQAECYDAKKAAQVYLNCGEDVLQAVCKLMEVDFEQKLRLEPRDAEQQHFDEMRAILKSKYDLYHEIMLRSSPAQKVDLTSSHCE